MLPTAPPFFSAIRRNVFEFFMLFLAVWLGFATDYLREETEKQDREERYMRSMRKDLMRDTVQLSELTARFDWKRRGLDSLLVLFGTSAERFPAAGYGMMQRQLSGFPDFIPADATLRQLKEAGGLQLIDDEECVSGILRYDAAVQGELMHQEAMNDFLLGRLWERHARSLDLLAMADAARRDFAPPLPRILLSSSPDEHIRFRNDVVQYRALVLLQLNIIGALKADAAALLTLLRERYPE